MPQGPQDDILAFYRGKHVMITGGLGFIGSNLAGRMVDLGAKVCIVDAMLPNFGGNLANIDGLEGRVAVNIVNLNDPERLDELLIGCDVIFNLAGHMSHIDSMAYPVTDLQANVLAQINLLEACRRLTPNVRIVFASTRQIYGRPSYLPVDENHPLRPVDVNGINKMAAEAYHTLYHEVYGLWTLSLRLTNTYGPRMRIKDARQNFLGFWLRQVVEGGAFEVWGGAQKRDLCYVDDVVDAFLLAAGHDKAAGGVFNVGGSPPVALSDLAQIITAVAGTGSFACKAFPAERKRIDIGDYYANDRRFREVTGWEPRVDLKDGLARSIDYYRKYLAAYV
jgi:UDP-glucose 4-epimerase